MTNNDTPHSRRVLAAFTQAKWDTLDPAKRRNLSGQPGVGVLVIDGQSRIDRGIAERVLTENTVSHGMVLVQNPYDTAQYFPDDEAAMEIALKKTLCIAQVCQLLGAREFTVNSIESKSDGTKWNASGGAGAKGMKAKFRGGGGKSTQLARKIDLSDSSSGGEADVEAAISYLRQHQLESDSMLKSLVDAAAFDGNKIQKRTLTVDVSRESRRSMELAMDVSALAFGSGKGGGGREAHTVDQFAVTYEISF